MTGAESHVCNLFPLWSRTILSHVDNFEASKAECLSPLLFFLLWRHGTGQVSRLRACVLNLIEAYDRDLTGHHLSHKYFF